MNTTANYKAIEARKFRSEINGQIQISSKNTITNVTKVENGLSVGFVFTNSYEPDIGFIRIEGEIFIPLSPEEADNTIKEWKSSGKKRLPEEMAETVHNSIISNCIMEAAIISREIQLPPPFPIPHIQIGKEQTSQPTFQQTEVNNDTTRYIQ